ncbi:hypothetical protein TNCT1_03490 [Streptomyces sp. 1-11]|nr:hypothetical protein TNCT1_03490 [Streptomyces sp. 1-11]
MSEGYEGNTPADPAGSLGGTGTTSDHAGIPFLGHVFRVSDSRRDHVRARRAAPDGWIRRA